MTVRQQHELRPPSAFSPHPAFHSLLCSAIDSIQIDGDLGAFVSSLSAVAVLKDELPPAESP